MGFRRAKTYFKCRIAINIVLFLLSVVSVRICVFIAKSQIFRRLCTGNSSLCGTGLIADGKSGYFTVCLDLEVISLISVKQKQQSDEYTFGSLQTRGRAKGIWGELPCQDGLNTYLL